MSSVTRLHLLSQSMLNVSCQKQKHRSSFPADSYTESFMEFVGQPRPSGACDLLGVPGHSSLDVDDDEGEVVIGIRPKSSPLPRRKSSVSDDDSEPEPPLSGSRRVSFADAKGLSLVQVKEFDKWDVPKLPGYESSEGEGTDAEEYFLSPLTFSLPLSTEELFARVQEQKVELEAIKLLPGTTILKGVVRVLNLSFNKAVYIRTTLDTWTSHFDLLAEYIPGSSDGLMDCFSFKLTLVPPFGEQGARVDFCLRYETPVGTFWANNNDRNYVLICHHRMSEAKENPQKENVNKKSCLKTFSQTFSTAENISAQEASSQGNIAADVSNRGLEEDAVKAKKVSDDQLGTSEEQKFLMENRQKSSRRSRRKAARMARVRDYFAQRDRGANDSERDESPPEIKQAAQQEAPTETHRDVQSFSEGNKSEGSQLVSESPEACREAVRNVLHDTSPTHDHTPNCEPEICESITLADSVTLTGGESDTDIPDNTLHSVYELPPAEQQNISKFVTEDEESSHNQSYEGASNTAVESSDSLMSQTNSFTFGTVVAPLYHQVFGRAGSESQSVGDWGSPVWATLKTGDLNPHSEMRQISCFDPTDTRSNDGRVHRVQGNVIHILESNHQRLDCTLNSAPTEEEEEEEEEEETSLSVTVNNVLGCADTLQDAVGTENLDQKCANISQGPKPLLGDTLGHPETNILLNTDLLNIQMPTESLYLQGEAQEDNVTHDLQSQSTIETPRSQLPEQTNVDETGALSATPNVTITLQTSVICLQPSQSVSGPVIEVTDQRAHSAGGNKSKCEELNKDHDTGNTVTTSKTSLKEDKLLESLDHHKNSVTKETEKSLVSCCELVEKTDFTTRETNNMEDGVAYSSHKDETKRSGEVAESMTEAVMSNYHRHSSVFEYTSEKLEPRDMEAAVSKQNDNFCLSDISEVKNWEMMVEEEENNILTNAEENEPMHLKAGDTGATVKEDTEEKKKEKSEEFLEEITAAGVEEDKADSGVGLEDKERIKEEELRETVGGKESADVETKLGYGQITKVEKTTGEEELSEVEKTEGPEETELQEEKHFAEMQQIDTERTNVQQEETEGEEKMEVDLKDEGQTNVELMDQKTDKKENPDYEEEILVDEAGEAEILDRDSCMAIEDREDEVGCLEERLDVTQNKAEDGLSALVNNGQQGVNERAIDKENTSETCLYKEEGSQSYKNVTHDRSKAEIESSAAEGAECILTDQPENDQTSHDSASAESDSDDEVELYMHCLRAVRTAAQAHKDRNKDTGFTVSKRPSVSRSRRLSAPMPSICESVDEEQHLSCLQENREDMKTAAVAALSASSGQEGINRNVSWWKDTFSCSNISKTLLYTTLLVVFLVMAYHYDFLACFGLYLISVVWLCCQGEKQPIKNNNRIG